MEDVSDLIKIAINAASNAYAPYSKFKVGCALRASSGKVYAGCNVENVSYPVGTCAEAGAIAAMVCGGDSKIKDILIYADSDKLISPCGACRQRIVEFSDKETKVYLSDRNGIQKTMKAEELLPFCFKEF